MVREIEELFVDIQNSCTVRLGRWLESSIEYKLEKLYEAAIRGRTDADI